MTECQCSVYPIFMSRYATAKSTSLELLWDTSSGIPTYFKDKFSLRFILELWLHQAVTMLVIAYLNV